jgi:hypothetical protein
VRVVVVALVPKRFVAKKLVLVAWDEVELTAVKFWRVVDPVSWRFESVVSPPIAVRVPARFVVPPTAKEVETYEVVEVAFVEVEVRAVKFCKVEDALTKREPMTSSLAPVVVVAVAPMTTAVAVLG